MEERNRSDEPNETATEKYVTMTAICGSYILEEVGNDVMSDETGYKD